MAEDEPITVVIRHRVRSGKEPAFEDWLRGITQAALQFAGCQAFNVIRPTDPKHPDYVVLFRFDRLAHLEEWEQSSIRAEWLAKLKGLTVAEPMREKHTGLEVWFTPPQGRLQPPRWKMVVVTLLAIFPLVLVVQLTLAPYMANWPLLVRTLATSTLLVLTMTYIAMPGMTRLFSRWLYGI